MNRQPATIPLLASAALPRSRGLLQRKCACGNHTVAGTPCIARADSNRKLQRHALQASEAGSVPPIVHDVLRSAGQPLDAATRAYMEPRFGHDFSRVRASAAPMRSCLTIGLADDGFEREAESVAARIAETAPASARRDFGDVRVHTGGAAAESARAVGAQAYTVNRDIVFGAGQYAPPPWTRLGILPSRHRSSRQAAAPRPRSTRRSRSHARRAPCRLADSDLSRMRHHRARCAHQPHLFDLQA
jgi:hypothetical protein